MRAGRRPDREIFLKEVPDTGPIGNVSLIAKLKQKGWDADKYWRVRDELINDGHLEIGRGKGGSVRRRERSAKEIKLDGPKKAGQKRSYASPESKLYGPLKDTLSTQWTKERNIDPTQIQFEVTAKQGAKQTGGRWSRPDITAVSVRTFPHLPLKYLDVWTFEVKPAEWLDVTAVFEAAAHASRATRSYALLQVVDEEEAADTIARCETEAARLRVGLITFSDPANFETWETLVEAPRLDTSPENLQALINNLSEETRMKLLTWK